MKLVILIILFLGFSFSSFDNQKNWVTLKEGQSIDGYTKKNDKIYCGEISCNVKPMEGVDANSFQVCPGSSYAKDKNNVYYPINITCIDFTDCGVCYCDKYIIKEADVSHFEYLDKDYATDKIKIFFRGQELAGADGKTFKVINGPQFFYFAVDKNKVYKHDQIFANADPTTFYYDSTNSINDTTINVYIVADKNHKWKFTPPNRIELLK